MYLIHFHSKNIIKMCFPKSWVFKVSKLLQPLNFYLRRRRRKRPFYSELYALRHRTRWKKIIIIIYIVQNFYRFFDNILKYFFKKQWNSKLKIRLCIVVVHTILSRMVFFFFFWDKNWAAEAVLGRPTLPRLGL